MFCAEHITQSDEFVVLTKVLFAPMHTRYTHTHIYIYIVCVWSMTYRREGMFVYAPSTVSCCTNCVRGLAMGLPLSQNLVFCVSFLSRV